MKKFLINLIPIGKIKHRLLNRYFKQPVLNIGKDTHCLMVCPHADDEIIGAGACMIQHTKNFDCICISSSGIAYKNISAKERSGIRIAEFNKVMDTIGIKYHWIFETFGVPHFIKQIVSHFSEYMKVLNMKKYDYIFLPHPNDNHPEHKYITNVLIKKILRKQGYKKHTQIVFYEVWEPITNVNYYYDFPLSVMKKKAKLLDLYKSQNVWIKYSKRIIGLNTYRGMLAGNKAYAEAYKIVSVKDYLRGGL